MEAKEIRDSLEIRKAKVEIFKSIDEARASKIKFRQEEEKRELENEEKKAIIDKMKRKEDGWRSPIAQLLEIASAWCIDNSQTVIGSEPAFRSLWDEDELAEIKDKIMKKMREL